MDRSRHRPASWSWCGNVFRRSASRRLGAGSIRADGPSRIRTNRGEINDAGVDILVVGLGKPLQENWINRHGSQTGAQVLLAFGAVVDFLAGRIRRAPEPIVQAGAEWAWRLMLEPRRLGRRYLIDGPPALVRLRRKARVVEAASTRHRRTNANAAALSRPATMPE